LVVDADDRFRLLQELDRLRLPHDGPGPIRIPVDGRKTHAMLKSIETPLTLVKTHSPTLEDAYLEIVGRDDE
jgi:ABC-2 type transport system ATP-binding protein